MKLCETEQCYKTLKNVFDRPTKDWTLASGLCDLMTELEKQYEKYAKLRNKWITENCDITTEGRWTVKPDKNVQEVNKEKENLDSLEFEFKKVNVNKIEELSPTELKYLREFFIFE